MESQDLTYVESDDFSMRASEYVTKIYANL